MVTDKIADYLTNPPSQLQIAKDQNWEECKIFDLHNSSWELADMQTYLESSAFQDLRIEVIFDEGNKGIFIFGMAWNSRLLTKTPGDFLQQIRLILQEYSNFRDFITQINLAYIGYNYLFTPEADMVRLGVVNHWFSVGPVQIWQKGEPKSFTLDKIRKLIASNPAVKESNLNYQGLSFLYNLANTEPGMCHWIKTPSSVKIGHNWVADYDKILKFLQEFLI